MFGSTSGALFPVQEEFAVTVGEAGRRIDIEFGDRPVNPIRRAFELDVVPDWSFVHDQVSGSLSGMGPFGAEFFVNEDGGIAELIEDFGERVAVGYGGFGLDADLIARVAGALIGQAFVGECTDVAVLANAEELTLGAEIAVWSVEESVVFKGPSGLKMEA